MFNDIILSKLRDYDENCRDDNNDIPNTPKEKKKQFITNIIKEIDIDNCKDYAHFSTIVNNEFYNAYKHEKSVEARNFFKGKTNNKIKSKYISGIITKNDISVWNKHNIFILAGTGKGKNTFIQNNIIKKGKKNKVVIFLNRNSLYKQQVTNIINSIQKRDDYDSKNIYKEFKSSGVITIDNVMLITYQAFSSNVLKKDIYKFFRKAKYAVFDEIHYLLDDAEFNKATNLFLDYLLYENATKHNRLFPKATKIFMSATMEETLLLFYLSEYNFNEMSWVINFSSQYKHNQKTIARAFLNNIYYLPTNYSYITPFCYSNYEDIIERIGKTNGKWLIFVNSIDTGKIIKNKISEMYNDKTVRFINADNKKNKDNKAILRSIYKKESMNCDILITTSVLYNGINLKDKELKNIVVPFTTISIAKQIIGRKRVDENENVNVYFYNASEEEIYNVISKKIDEYFKIIQTIKVITSNPLKKAAALNEMLDFPKKYYYTYEDNDSIQLKLNKTAVYKLHFDTMFYLFILKKFDSQKNLCVTDISSAYVNSLLEHLGIKYKINDIQNITILNEEQRTERARNAMITLIKEYLQPQIDKKINGKFKTIIELQTKVNEIYKDFSGKNINIHFQTKTRSLPPEDINDVLSELNIDYEYIRETPETGVVRYFFKDKKQDK